MGGEMTDTERLDWLESMGYGIRSRYWGTRNLLVWNKKLPGFDIRTAIDCAMKRHVLYIKGEKKCWLHQSFVGKCCNGIKGQPF